VDAWLRGRGTTCFLALLVFAAALRLYYFGLTRDQPLWWDEAGYMLKAKSLAFGTPLTGWYSARPILMPLFVSMLLRIGAGETTVRLLWVVLSTAGLVFLYRIGRILFNERVGLCAIALGAVLYVDLFYTARLLTDVPQVFFVMAAAFLLVRSVVHGDPSDVGLRRDTWAIGALLALGTATRFTVGLFAVVTLLFLLAVKGRTLLRAVDWYVSLVGGALMLLPFGLYYAIAYGSVLRPFEAKALTQGASSGLLLRYVRYLPNYTTPLATVFLLIGIGWAAAVIARHPGRIRSEPRIQGYVLLLLWIAVPGAFFTGIVDHFEDRYLVMLLPAVLLMIGIGLDAAYVQIGKRSRALACAVVIAVVAYSAYVMAAEADTIIRKKVESFQSVRAAGLWIKQHSVPGDRVVSASVPQITYYSERATIDFPAREGDFEAVIETGPRYIVLSAWQWSPDWAYEWPSRHPDKVSVVAVFDLDSPQRKYATVVYALK
jgi:4-amino-4-deoxy-L-arabinose transferase-like glycosyltransferase